MAELSRGRGIALMISAGIREYYSKLQLLPKLNFLSVCWYVGSGFVSKSFYVSIGYERKVHKVHHITKFDLTVGFFWQISCNILLKN